MRTGTVPALNLPDFGVSKTAAAAATLAASQSVPQEAASMPKEATSRTLGVRCSSRTAQQTAPWLHYHPFDGPCVPEFSKDIAGLHLETFLFACGVAALRVEDVRKLTAEAFMHS